METYLSPLNFFTLPSNYKQIYLEEILLLVRYGGFSRQDLMVTPVNERKFYLNKLVQWKKKNET